MASYSLIRYCLPDIAVGRLAGKYPLTLLNTTICNFDAARPWIEPQSQNWHALDWLSAAQDAERLVFCSPSHERKKAMDIDGVNGKGDGNKSLANGKAS